VSLVVLRDSATAELLVVVVGPMRSNSSKTALWLYVAQWAASRIVQLYYDVAIRRALLRILYGRSMSQLFM
jgi:hypothetical protein